MHMYAARKNVLENREITLILKGEMSFATETRLAVGYRCERSWPQLQS
jgi:hypothetical protein